MARATHFPFGLAAPLLVGMAMVVSVRAQPSGSDIDQMKLRPARHLAPRALFVEPTAPVVVLDGVMYLESTPRSDAVGVRRAAATPRRPGRPSMWEFGVIHRRIAERRYY
jgi:hypothetical protein